MSNELNINNGLIVNGKIISSPGTSSNELATFGQLNTNRVGIIYNKSSWSDLNDFVTNSLNVTVSASKLLVPDAGVTDFSKNLQFVSFSCINHWKMEIEFQLLVQTGSSTTGISIGIQSTNTSSLNSWANYFRMVNDGNNGRMEFFGQSNNGSYASIGNSGFGLIYAQNDKIKLEIERSNLNVWLRATNISKTSQIVQYTTSATLQANPIPNNTGHFTIFGQGGSCAINRITIYNNELKRPDVLFLGDSKTLGYGSSALKLTYPGYLGSKFKKIAISAGFGDKTTDLLSHMNEILNISPKNVVLSIGSNDKRFGVSFNNFTASYQNITNQLLSASINVVHLSPSYESTQDLSDQYGYVTNSYSQVVDIFNIFRYTGSLYSDGIHWTDSGSIYAAYAILDSNYLVGFQTNQEYL